MVRKKMERSEWWLKRLSFLKGTEHEAKKLYQITQKAYEKPGLWPVLKLCALAYYLPGYLQIASRHFKNICYIDTCSSCGLVKVKDRVFLGSPILAERAKSNDGTRTFDKLFFIDNDQQSCDALAKIIDNNRSKVCYGDSNEELPKIIEKINHYNNSHFVCFVDPEGMELPWSTIELLLKSKGDIIINYMCAGVVRNFHNSYKMNSFFGETTWEQYKDEENRHECLFNLYLEKIRKLKPITIDVKIRGEKSFHYHIIFAFAKEGWKDIISNVKTKIESANLQEIKTYLDIQENKQKTLF